MTNPFSKDFSAVKRLKNGDQQAFEELYEKYFRLVKHVIYQIISNDMISEDLTQETFLRMYESISSFENNTSFSAWLCTIGRNLALNEKKKRQREMEWKDYDKTDETSNPQEESQKKEDLERIKSFLPEKDYEIVIYSLYHRLSYQEISEITGESVPALTNRYHRAVKKIKEKIK